MRLWRCFRFGAAAAGMLLTVIPARAQRAPGQAAPQQLPSGKVEGTFRLRYTGQVKFSQDPVFPIHIMLFTDQQIPVSDLTVPDASPFTVETDLLPGAYQIRSEVLSASDAGYWGADGPSFFVASTGVTRYFLPANNLLHVKKLQLLTQNPQHLGPASGSGLTVRWEALRGAARYHISWTEQAMPKHEKVGGGADDVTSEEYIFAGQVHANHRYELFIHAFDGGGRLMAASVPFYFYTTGGH